MTSTTPKKTLLPWSSGEDSAWALRLMQQDPSLEVVGLITTLNEGSGRIGMHAVREAFVDAQAEAVGLPPGSAHAAPMFGNPIAVLAGERVDRGGFSFGDLTPVDCG